MRPYGSRFGCIRISLNQQVLDALQVFYSVTQKIILFVSQCLLCGLYLVGKVSSILGAAIDGTSDPRHGPRYQATDQNSAVAIIRALLFIINLWSIVSPYVTIRGCLHRYGVSYPVLRIRNELKELYDRLIYLEEKKIYNKK